MRSFAFLRFLPLPAVAGSPERDLSESDAAMIIKARPSSIRGADHYLDEANEIAAFCHALGARIVQLHGEIDHGELKRLKTLAPSLTVIKSLVVGMHDEQTLEVMVSEYVAVRRCLHHRHLRSKNRRLRRHRQDTQLDGASVDTSWNSLIDRLSSPVDSRRRTSRKRFSRCDPLGSTPTPVLKTPPAERAEKRYKNFSQRLMKPFSSCEQGIRDKNLNQK